MNVIVFKLLSGEEVVGRVVQKEDISIEDAESLDIIDAMYIAETSSGSMKLRDVCMLARENVFTISAGSILGYYYPSEVFVSYYEIASQYAQEITRDTITGQIAASICDLEEQLKEDRALSSKLTDWLMNYTKSTLQ